MSGFVDFVVANRSEAASVLACENVGSNWPSFEWKWIRAQDLEPLLDVLLDGWQLPSLRRWLRRRFPLVSLLLELRNYNETTGASVEFVPYRLVRLLSRLTPDEIPKVVAGWKQRAGHLFWEEADLEDFVAQLSDFARRAVAQRKTLLLRQSNLA